MNETPKISVLAIGNELLDGRVTDTNSTWIGFELRKIGLSLFRTTTCGDTIEEIVSSLKNLFEKSDLVIISGGLGPTTDDLTREGVAKLTGVTLIQDKASLTHIESYFSRRNRPVNEANKRQSFLPQGATYIENPVGSAPGFSFNLSLHGTAKTIFALPGVPMELKEMCRNFVFPSIASKFPHIRPRAEVGFRVFGLPESEIGQRLVDKKLPPDIEICYRVIFPEIEVLLRHPDEKVLADALSVATSAIGSEFILGDSPNLGLDSVVMNLCLANQLTLATAESCTGGMLGEIITAIPGSSRFYLGGVVSYSNELKEMLLDVPTKLINTHGAVSKEVAESMVIGLRQRTKADYAISITGVAGPDGGTEEKPVGTVFIGCASKSGIVTQKIFLPASRERIRRYSACVALDLVRRSILGLPLKE